MRTHLHRTDLRGSNLSQANLTGADLSNADLRGAELTETILKKAIFYGANMSSEELRMVNLSKHPEVKLQEPMSVTLGDHTAA